MEARTKLGIFETFFFLFPAVLPVIIGFPLASDAKVEKVTSNKHRFSVKVSDGKGFPCGDKVITFLEENFVDNYEFTLAHEKALLANISKDKRVAIAGHDLTCDSAFKIHVLR